MKIKPIEIIDYASGSVRTVHFIEDDGNYLRVTCYYEPHLAFVKLFYSIESKERFMQNLTLEDGYSGDCYHDFIQWRNSLGELV